MSCFFIGPPDKQIFANLTEPREDSADAVVLLCYPFGQEYMRAHRAYRQLATLLGRSGFYSLRFDYPSSGDSYGVKPLRSFDGLIEDLIRVVDEAKNRSGKDRVYICGLRFGSLVSASLASLSTDIKALILWDAYADGAGFINDCKSQLSGEVAGDGIWGVHGYPLTQEFRQDVDKVDISKLTLRENIFCHHVASFESEAASLLRDRFGPRFEQHLIHSNGDWNYVDMEGSILIPTPIIKAICAVVKKLDSNNAMGF